MELSFQQKLEKSQSVPEVDVALRQLFVTVSQQDIDYSICKDVGVTLHVAYEQDEQGVLCGCVDGVVTQGEWELWPFVTTVASECVASIQSVMRCCSWAASPVEAVKELKKHPFLEGGTQSSSSTSSSLPPFTKLSFGIQMLQAGLNNTDAIATPPLCLRCEQLQCSVVLQPQLCLNVGCGDLSITLSDGVSVLERRLRHSQCITA